MSSRVPTSLPTLGERVEAMKRRDQPKGQVPAHIWVHLDGTWRAGLLTTWTKHVDGWWGTVACVREGEAQLVEVEARLLRPAD